MTQIVDSKAYEDWVIENIVLSDFLSILAKELLTYQKGFEVGYKIGTNKRTQRSQMV